MATKQRKFLNKWEHLEFMLLFGTWSESSNKKFKVFRLGDSICRIPHGHKNILFTHKGERISVKTPDEAKGVVVRICAEYGIT